jgi:hypothetical protein
MYKECRKKSHYSRNKEGHNHFIFEKGYLGIHLEYLR